MSGGSERSDALHCPAAGQGAHEMDYPLVVSVNQFVHITLDLVGLCHYFIQLSDCFTFELCFLSPILNDRNDALYIFGTVVGLVIDLAVCQCSIISERLQRAWTDVEHPTHVLIVHPLTHCLFSMPLADSSMRLTKRSNLATIASKVLFFD